MTGFGEVSTHFAEASLQNSINALQRRAAHAHLWVGTRISAGRQQQKRQSALESPQESGGGPNPQEVQQRQKQNPSPRMERSHPAAEAEAGWTACREDMVANTLQVLTVVSYSAMKANHTVGHLLRQRVATWSRGMILPLSSPETKCVAPGPVLGSPV